MGDRSSPCEDYWNLDCIGMILVWSRMSKKIPKCLSFFFLNPQVNVIVLNLLNMLIFAWTTLRLSVGEMHFSWGIRSLPIHHEIWCHEELQRLATGILVQSLGQLCTSPWDAKKIGVLDAWHHQRCWIFPGWHLFHGWNLRIRIQFSNFPSKTHRKSHENPHETPMKSPMKPP